MQINSSCKIHKAKEEFVCTNKKCIETQKSLSCYICLSAKHQKASHNSTEDFKTIEGLLEQINKEKDKKHILLELAKQWCLAFQKDKRQQIEKCIFYTPDYLQKIINQIDEKVNQLSTYLNQISRLLLQISENKIESLQQVLELSALNCQKLEQLIEKKKQETIIQIEEIESKVDLNIYETFQHYKTKVQNLESKMNKQNSHSCHKVLLSTILLVLVANSINQLIPVFQKQQSEIECKQPDEISSLSSELNLLKEQLQNHINKTEEILLLLQQNKTDSGNSDNKIKEYFKLKLTDQSETLLKIISDKSQSLNSRVYDVEQLLSLQILPNIKEIKQNQKTLNETLQKKVPSQINQVSEAQQTLSNQVDYAKAYLLGKIHLNIEISKLKGFQLIFKQTLDKPFRKQEELEILLKVKNDTILCLGSQLVAQPEHLQVIACDYPEEIFQETLDWQQARRSQNGNIYWYKMEKHSIGFAPTENVKLVLCDDYDLEDDRRFSYWYNNGNEGGRRIGNRNNLKNSMEHYMVVYAL